MLGTLVALTVARMPNLETFIWDMPTGVLREVWDALANVSNGHRSRLEKVWVRFHDNKEVIASTNSPQVSDAVAPVPNSTGASTTSDPHPDMAAGSASISRLEVSYRNTECPSFSILPPLKSLTVLDIDEPAYLAEMSVLMQRSFNSLRELRIGISGSYRTGPSTNVQHSNEDPNMQYLADGGLLGLIMSKIYDCRTPLLRPDFQESISNSVITAAGTVDQGLPQPPILPLSPLSVDEETRLVVPASINLLDSPGDVHNAETVSNSPTPTSELSPRGSTVLADTYIAPTPCFAPHALGLGPIADPQKQLGLDERQILDESVFAESAARPMLPEYLRGQRLRLEVLELENIALHVPVLQHSINWSMLTSLTFLRCSGHGTCTAKLYFPNSYGFYLPITFHEQRKPLACNTCFTTR